MFPDPDYTHTCITDKLHCTVSHIRSRAEHEHRNCSGRNMNDPFFIRNGYRAVRTAQFTVLKVKKGHSVANLRQRLNGRADHPRDFSH